jgi:hypothetical protein
MANKELPEEAIQLSSLSAPAKTAAKSIVGSMGANIKGRVRTAASSQYKQSDTAAAKADQADTPADASSFSKKSTAYKARGRRLEGALPALKNKKLTVQDAAANRVELVEKAAKDLAPLTSATGDVERLWKQDRNTKQISKDEAGAPQLSGVKLPHESIAGVGFYHKAHEDAVAALSYNPEAAHGATAVASSRARIEDEAASFNEVSRVHHPESSSSVYMHPAIVDHLESRGISVGANQRNKYVHVRELSSAALASLTESSIRGTVHANSKDVNFTDLAKTNQPKTLVKLIDAVRGTTAADQIQNPLTAPKTWSFARNKADASPDTRDEYEARAYHLGKTIRKEIHGSQEMFDFSGLRDSNEGILSNEGHTTEDSWMHSVSARHLMSPKYPDKKVMGEILPSAKTAKVNGKNVTVYAHPDFSGGAVQHLFGNAATIQAAKDLQAKHGLSYTVPSAMVQETAWAAARREDYKETSTDYKSAAASMMGSLREQETVRRANLRANAKASASLDKNTAALSKGKAPKPPADGMLF